MAAHDCGHGELLVELAGQRLMVCLPRLAFAARKLPAAGEVRAFEAARQRKRPPCSITAAVTTIGGAGHARPVG